jgi:hypothetical protein
MWSDLKEPTLAELMAEPIIRAVMVSDAVREADLRQLIAAVSTRLESQRPRSCRRADCAGEAD